MTRSGRRASDGGHTAVAGTDSPSEADPPAELRSPVLRAAVQGLESELTGEDPGAADRHGITRKLHRLAMAVEDEDGNPVDLHGASAAEVAVLQRLLERFSTQVIREWNRSTTPPSSDEMLQLLRAFDRVRSQLAPDEQQFASLLSTPHGPELIVELAHDLRSPLTSILFLADTLQRGQSGEVSDLQHRQLGIIYSAALGMVSMASDVIELARGGERLMDRTPTAFSVSEMLSSISDLVRPMAEEKGLALRVLPPMGDQRLGYPVALSRVLLNLTNNALKFTQDGFVEIVARATDLTRVEFSVRDTGNGLDEETQQHLFEPFRRNPSSQRYGFSGSGLGLAICQKLSRAMGSELRYETAPGWGTRFFLELELPPKSLM